jgi:hypothetical protein
MALGPKPPLTAAGEHSLRSLSKRLAQCGFSATR